MRILHFQDWLEVAAAAPAICDATRGNRITVVIHRLISGKQGAFGIPGQCRNHNGSTYPETDRYIAYAPNISNVAAVDTIKEITAQSVPGLRTAERCSPSPAIFPSSCVRPDIPCASDSLSVPLSRSRCHVTEGQENNEQRHQGLQHKGWRQTTEPQQRGRLPGITENSRCSAGAPPDTPSSPRSLRYRNRKTPPSQAGGTGYYPKWAMR